MGKIYMRKTTMLWLRETKITTKRMERYFSVMSRKIHCSQNGSLSQVDLQTQYNPNQNPGKLLPGYQQMTLKSVWRSKGRRIGNMMWKEADTVGELLLLNSP